MKYKYQINKGVIKFKSYTKRILIGVIGLGFPAALMISSGAGAVVSQNFSLFGDASIVTPGNPGHAAEATSNSSGAGYGGVSFSDPSGLTLNDLNTLSTDYQMTAGDCGGGSPRFSIGLDTGSGTKNLFVYLGSSPNYDSCATTWTNTGNLVSAPSIVDASQLGGAFYDTYSNVQTNYGNDPIVSIEFVIDGSWKIDPQTVQVDNTQINDTSYDYEPVVTVTIAKYLDNSQASASNANSTAFPMESSWNATNIGSGTGSYTLSPSGFNNPNPYQATTSDMTAGADYSTHEVLGSIVSSTCTPFGAPYALVGYTTGDSISAAESATPSTTAPDLTNIQNNQYVIVWNVSCKTPTGKDQCKNDGWKDFNAPVFRNQGLCVAWVEHNVLGHGTPAANKPSH